MELFDDHALYVLCEAATAFCALIAALYLGYVPIGWVHEFGHATMAKVCGLWISEIQIGHGKTLFKFTIGRRKIPVFVNIVPGGGHVISSDLADQQSSIILKVEDARGYLRMRAIKFALVVLAGPVASLLLATGILAILGQPDAGSMNFTEQLSSGIQQVISIARDECFSVWLIISGIAYGADNVDALKSLPFVEHIIHSIHNPDLRGYLYWVAVLSIPDGILNLLPFRGSDGAKLISEASTILFAEEPLLKKGIRRNRR